VGRVEKASEAAGRAPQVTSAPADCDREPIHIPGAIQPHGVLLVVATGGETILAAAGDVAGVLGHDGDPRGAPLADVIGSSLADLASASGLSPGEEPLYLGSLAPAAGRRELDILAHERGGKVILELEPSLANRPSAARLLARLRAAVARIKAQNRLEEACRVAAAEVRDLTGFDRALVYRFLDDGAGKVVAEDGNGALPVLLNQHFPATDIPRQARALYVRNLIRVIPDIGYTPAPLLDGDEEEPLDMSDCALRSVSPVHLQYLRNMGVGSSMSVSILGGDDLWGMIACHSAAPRLVPYETREACKQIATALTQQAETIAARVLAEEATRLGSEREQLLARLAASESLEQESARLIAELERLIPCDGVVVCYNGQPVRSGVTPTPDECLALAAWARRRDSTPPFSSACLTQECDLRFADPGCVAGLLAITVSQEDPLEVLWLRTERAETIEWAGHPHKGATGTPAALTPRASFEVWRETVRGKALAWTEAEVEAAQRMREGMERIKERQSISKLQSSLIQVSRLNAMGSMASSIAHEINQPLMAVASYTRAAARLLAQQEQRDEELAMALERAAEQSLRAGEILRHMRRLVAPAQGKIDRCSLSSILDGASAIALLDAERMGVDVDIAFDRDAAVLADPIQVQQVLLNLVRNALEAMEGAAERRLSIRAEEIPSGFVQVEVADSGPGVPLALRPRLFSTLKSEKENGLGIGLSICRTIVEAHGGKIWFEPVPDGGSRFSFLLPSAGIAEERVPQARTARE
jgi:light-regulated signal transduction histidine kinase (bacteriophytochrome)